MQKWQSTFAVLFLAVSLLIPQSAKAQCSAAPVPMVFNSTLINLEQALSEIQNNQYVIFSTNPQTMPPSIQAIQNDLQLGPGPHLPVDEFLQRVIDALAYGADHVRAPDYVPGVSDYGDPYTARVLIRTAMGYEVPPGTTEYGPVSLLHTTLTKAFVPLNNLNLTSVAGDVMPYSSDSFTMANRLINHMILGGGPRQSTLRDVQLKSLYLAVSGQPDATEAFRVLSGGIIGPSAPPPFPCAEPGATCSNCSTPNPDQYCWGWPNGGLPQCSFVGTFASRFNYIFATAGTNWYSGTVNDYINTYYSGQQTLFLRNFVEAALHGVSTWSDGSPNSQSPINLMGWTMGWWYGLRAYTPGCVGPNPGSDTPNCHMNNLARQWADSLAYSDYWVTPAVTTPPPDPSVWTDPGDPDDAGPAAPPASTPFDPNTTYPDLNNDANYQGDNEYHPYIDDEEILATGNNTPCDGYVPNNDDDHPLEDNKNWSSDKDPCVWTHDNDSLSPGIDYAEENQGDNEPPQDGEGHKAGWLFSNYLAHWWKYEFLPALQDYTKEDSAGKSDGARQEGTVTDAKNIAKTSKVIQKEELKAKRQYQPNEKTCVVGSHTSVATTTENVATALSQGVASELSAAAGDMSGSYDNPSNDPPTSEGGGGSGDPGGKNVHNQGTYNRARLGSYCANFQDSDANNGDNICTIGRSDLGKDSDAKPMNADIDIEGFLLKDTLQMTELESKDSAISLLQNLIYPKVMPEIPDDVLDKTVAGQYILVKEHIEGVKKIAADVVSSMLARRAGISLPEKYIKSVNPGYGLPPDSNTGLPVDASNYEAGTPVPETGDFYAWRKKLLSAEGGGNYKVINGYNYLGIVQMGESTLIGVKGKPNFIKEIHDNAPEGQNQLGMIPRNGRACSSLVSNPYAGASPMAPCVGNHAACARKYSPQNIVPCNGTPAQCKRSYVLCNDDSGDFPSWQRYKKFRTYTLPDDAATQDIFPIGDATYAVRVFDYEWIAAQNFPDACAGVTTNKAYIESDSCQLAAHFITMQAKWRTIKAIGLTAYIGKVVNGVFIGPSGLLLAGWGGPGRLKQWLTNDPAYKPDKYGTTMGERIILGNGHNLSTPIAEYNNRILIPAADVPQNYGTPVTPVVIPDPIDSQAAQDAVAAVPVPQVTVTPEGDTQITPLPPGVGTGQLTDVPGPGGTIKQMIRAIREKAGIPPGDISDAPSYNEVMKALTKERFLNPEYYATLAADVGQLKQEQAGVNAYISIQLQDIYKLQEQINALMAARAGMKLNKEEFDDLLEASAVRRNP